MLIINNRFHYGTVIHTPLLIIFTPIFLSRSPHTPIEPLLLELHYGYLEEEGWSYLQMHKHLTSGCTTNDKVSPSPTTH